MTFMNILIFGHVCIDENKSENSQYRYWGSPAMFMHKVFKKISDSSVSLVSNYGGDYVEYLSEVDIHPEKPTQKKTLVYQNVSKEGKRTQKALFREHSEQVILDEKLKEKIRNADCIVFAPILPNYDSVHIADILKHAKKTALKVLLPQGYFRNFDKEHNVIFRNFTEADEILSQFDLVTLSEDDYPRVEELSEKWAKKHKTNIVITRGKNSALAITQDGTFEIPTEEIPEDEIVDSVGSGDTFSAALIHQLQKTQDLKEAVAFAHKVAGESLRSTHAKK